MHIYIYSCTQDDVRHAAQAEKREVAASEHDAMLLNKVARLTKEISAYKQVGFSLVLSVICVCIYVCIYICMYIRLICCLTKLRG